MADVTLMKIAVIQVTIQRVDSDDLKTRENFCAPSRDATLFGGGSSACKDLGWGLEGPRFES